MILVIRVIRISTHSLTLFTLTTEGIIVDFITGNFAKVLSFVSTINYWKDALKKILHE